jgi:rhomboid protease GluP
MVGRQVEKLYGNARFVILYLLTGMAGVLGSYFYNPDIVSAGASGAIFGLFGVLLVFGVRYRNSIPPAFKKAVGIGVLPIIVINLIIGFMIPAIDNAAHMTGLFSGAVLAAIVPFSRPGSKTHSFFSAAQAALLLMVAGSFYMVVAHYEGPNWRVAVPPFRSSLMR